MRTRVQTALPLFAVLALAAFAIPLLLFTASDRTQELVLARSADLDHFASLMDQAAAAGDTSAVTAEARGATHSCTGNRSSSPTRAAAPSYRPAACAPPTRP